MRTETITVIIPCFNEEEALPVYYQAMPVSYTHLDVYKRQVRDWIDGTDGSTDYCVSYREK